jgi:hypothetical protein
MMYGISFRIENVGNYQDRWRSIVDVVRSEAIGGVGKTWEETTSFFVIESAKGTEELAGAIYTQSLFKADKDMLLVLNLSVKDHATRGIVPYEGTLGNLLSRR